MGTKRISTPVRIKYIGHTKWGRLFLPVMWAVMDAENRLVQCGVQEPDYGKVRISSELIEIKIQDPYSKDIEDCLQRVTEYAITD